MTACSAPAPDPSSCWPSSPSPAYGVLKATAHTKLLNFSSNVGGFLLFAAVGAVAWKIGLLMGAAQFCRRLGSARPCAMKKGAANHQAAAGRDLHRTCRPAASGEPDHPLRILVGL